MKDLEIRFKSYGSSCSPSLSKDFIDRKIFKVHLQQDGVFNEIPNENERRSNVRKKAPSLNNFFTLRQILNSDKTEIENKIFVVNYRKQSRSSVTNTQNNKGEPKFMHV